MVETLDYIAEQLGEDETLVIACEQFQAACKNRSPRITIKKIPQMLLDRCEWDKDDYSLNIVNLPHDETEDEDYIAEDYTARKATTEDKDQTLF